MAFAGPVGKDMHISFRLQSKCSIFNGNALQNAKVNLCASASSLGLVFVGSNIPELVVLCLKDLEAPSSVDRNVPIRKVSMPSPINQMATNCDGSLLTVDVSINGSPHIQLYSVTSFLTPNIQKVREFRISTDNAFSAQICWNPVLNSTLAICTTSGGLSLYAMKETGVEYHSTDAGLQVKCCCWSPKGKQIVAGLENGKLVQFNMELKPVRIIECPPGIFTASATFETIAVQWLSTYQFAVALSSQQEETRPVFYILNAPKNGQQQYIAYNDICYSTSEVRPSKIYLQFIQQWGMILVGSANCVDVSFLRISKPGDIPEWTQEFPNDQYPAELPLTSDKEETFPIGFELETACQGRILQEDGNPFPVMPMLHMLSTGGSFCSFYIQNTTPSYVDICSPPRQIDPRIINQFFTMAPPASVENVIKTPSNPMTAPLNHSTPAAVATVKTNLFGSAPPNVSAVPPVTQPTSTSFSGFSLISGSTQQQQPLLQAPSSFQFATKPATPTAQIASVAPQQAQPLITLSSTYNPPVTQPSSEQARDSTGENSSKAEVEDELVYIKMIQDEMKAFELEFNFVMEKSRSLKVRIGTKEESAEMRRQLEDLDELKKEATETIDSLRSDVQTHRLGLTEMFAMLYEAKAKCEVDNKSLNMNQVQDRSTKRKLENLNKMLGHCEMQVQIVNQSLNSQWSNYQDALNKNKKDRMHIPSLEGVYQTLTKQQEIIYQLNGKLKLIKSKLGICDDVNKQKNSNINATMESLSDSIISMSLYDQVQNDRAKLSDKKLENLRNYLSNRPVVNITPQRPKLPGLNSEIIIEKRATAIRNLRKRPETETLPKPTPTVAPIAKNISKPPTSESVFNVGQIHTQKTAVQQPLPPAAAAAASQTIQQLLSKKPDETAKSPSFSFGNSQTSFGLNLSGNSQPSFGSAPQASFGLSSTPLVMNSSAEKRKEEPQKPSPQQQPLKEISSAPNVTANFSMSLPPPKIISVPVKEPTKVVVEEKKEEPKVEVGSSETTSFTFSLPGKKEAPKQTAAVVSFGSTSLNVSDAAKSAFSFGSTTSANTFTFGNKSTGDIKTTVTTSPTTTFGGSSTSFTGFSSNPSDLKTSPPASVFSTLTPATTPAKSDESKVSPSTSIFATSSSAATVLESKPTSSFSFASMVASTNSPAAFATVPTGTAIFPVKSDSSQSSPPPPLIAMPISKPAVTSTGAETVLSGLSICSPEVSSNTPSTNIFSSPSFVSPNAADSSSSIFGNSAFTSAYGTTPVNPTSSTPSIFGANTSADKPQANVFGTSPLMKPDQSVFNSPPTTSAQSSSFGNIFSGASASPSSNIFATNTSTPPPSGGIFGSVVTPTATPSSNIFASSPATQTTPSIFSQSNFSTQPANAAGSIFSGSSSSPFGAANIFGSSTGQHPQQQGGSIFGGNAGFGNQSPSTQQAAPGNIFGGSATTPTSSAFGSSSIFSGGNQATFGGSATFSSFGGQQGFGSTGGGNIFNQQSQPTFGGGATFGSPKTNIFGSSIGSSSPQAAPVQSNNIFEQLGSQQSGNLFGSLAQTPTQSQQLPQQQQQQQGGVGFSGSAFSSWR